MVLLLHGLGGSRTAWRPQLEGLSATTASWPGTCPATAHRHRSTARSPSRPWPTRSPASSTRWAADRAHVVGLSMGGMIAQHAAVHHPDRVRSLALLSTSPAFGLDGTRPEDVASGPPRTARRRPRNRATTPSASITAIAGPDISAAAVAEQAAAMERITGPALRRADRLPGHPRPAAAAWAKSPRPRSCMTGALDRETPPAYGQALADGAGGGDVPGRPGRRPPPAGRGAGGRQPRAGRPLRPGRAGWRPWLSGVGCGASPTSSGGAG